MTGDDLFFYNSGMNYTAPLIPVYEDANGDSISAGAIEWRL
jgi:hypothetical protein